MIAHSLSWSVLVPMAFAVSVVHAGDVVVPGTITFRGDVPLSRAADDQGLRDPLLSVDKATRGLADAVIWLEPLDGQQPKDAPQSEMIVIDQKEMRFRPRLTAIRSGQLVRFTNNDPANHNVRAASFEPRNAFNVFTGTGGHYDHRFHAESKVRPVLIGCDIHAWMRAWVFVFNHPWYAVTDAQGRYRIEHVPPGRYSWHVRQPDGGLLVKREIALGEDQNQQFDHAFTTADLRAD